jgi:Tfp pilus assembly protein PilO
MNKNIITNIGIVFTVAVIIFFFFFIPQFNKWSVARENNLNKNKELHDLQRYHEELKELDKKLQSYQSILDRLDSALPEELSIPSFIIFLQQVTQESGVILKSFDTSFTSNPLKEGKELKKLKMNITVTGRYSSLRNLTSRLKQSAKVVDIESVSFSVPTEGDMYTFNIGLKTYSY